MERDLVAEIDRLNMELSQIKTIVQTLVNETREEVIAERPTGNVEIIKSMHSDKYLSNKMEELCTAADQLNISGLITYLGVFSSGGKQSNWIRNDVNTDGLLELIENHTAEKVLNCIGNSNRLTILLAILKKPMSVAELVTKCKLNTTGQVYHHMKPLLAADLIVEDVRNDTKGIYIVQPHKVQGIIMLLAGISDMVDETYSRGNWEES